MNATEFILPHVETAAGQPAPWRALFAWEWRCIGRNPLLWAVSGLVALAFCVGAWSGGGLQQAQQQAQQRQAEADAAWMRETLARVKAYARPAAQPAPYWQDPSDLAGFSRYQLRQHAYKPVLPLAALAVGGSDLAPSRWPVKLETPFGLEPGYDFESPRGLALGRFDLGFAIVGVLPLALIVLVALLATLERDRGMLRLIAAQAIHPRLWLGVRLLALAAWLLPLLALALSLALLLGGADLAAAWPEFLAAQALLAAYVLFWLALAAVVLSAWPGASAALGGLLSAWLLFALGLPLLGKLAADAWLPLPSRVLYVDAQRRIDDALNQQRDSVLTRAFRADPLLAPHIDRIAGLDYATRMSFLAPVREQQLQDWPDRFAQARAARERLGQAAGLIAVPLGLESALAVLAGTDAARQARYEAQVRAYQLQLRDWFSTRIRREIAAPTPRPAGSYARLNFTAHADIPAFAPADEPAAARVRAVLPLLAWLLAAAALLGAIAGWRLRRWPKEL
ncbi:ABC-2 type transport system permease protein [Tahibacter aquaticus]|uniref:ABC-2 type transport system permease protein n=1 Tax=Tahibacter aquaticus TaxID=520092 RepID=A0A4R6Z068_9GAMM|nr:DUF3526 domain-containing protein [Tahibacter aquaticus]TDR44882.1 ABC-2 type transport system permease protein [Tahibacter aquaticus]